MSTGRSNPGADPTPVAAGDRLDSWKEIAAYLRRSVRTVTRWERQEGLPVHRHVHSKTGTVYAYTAELDAWWASRGSRIEDSSADTARPGRRRARGPRIVAVAVGAVSLAVMAWFIRGMNSPVTSSTLIPLTTYHGLEGAPSLSPDGNQVAFERDGDIFAKQVDAEAIVQLTNTPEAEQVPAWSPDGRHIAFVRADAGIFLVSPFGGAEKKIAQTHAPLLLKTMAWTDDSRELIVSELTSSICASLFRISIATGEKTRLTWPSEPSIGDGWPAVSPDGHMLAFARYSQNESANIYLMPLSGGEPHRLTAEKASIFGLAWTPDGRELVFSSGSGGTSRLFRVPATSAARMISVLPVANSGDQARFPSISQAIANAPVRLAYQRFEERLDIRRAELSGEGPPPQRVLKPSARFISSTRSEDHPQYSPDGTKIAFASNRSGSWEIWLSNSDGSRLVRLTSLGGPSVIGPRWSPNSDRLVFFATTGVAGRYLTYIIGAEGGSPSRLSRDDSELEALPNWSFDGRRIYFASGRSGSLQVWQMPAAGGPPVQITKGGGADASESPDGRLFYAKVPEIGPGLWTTPVGGGEEIRVLDSVWFGYWAVTHQGIYYVDFNVPTDAFRPVKFFAFRDHSVTQIGTVEKSVSWKNNPGFAVSPDGRWLLYSSLESTDADLMLVDNFR